MTTKITDSKDYLKTLEELKSKIKSAQIKAHIAVNKEMLVLYWQIGRTILEKQKREKWGTKIIERLIKDLTAEFPQMKGLSKRNIEFMQQFVALYQDVIPKQLVSEIPLPPIFNIPWGHNIAIMQKVNHLTQRLWYAQKAVENGWSRSVLIFQIEANLYDRQAKKEIKTNNFPTTLPKESSDLANEIFKDEYNFEFIDNSQGNLRERQLEKALVDDIIKFLTELGKGFAFVGKQYHIEVEEEDFYIDLLFYHIRLKCYIVIELKTTKFKPEYVGKMGFYLACVDDYLRDSKDGNSIGIILCKTDDRKGEIKDKSLQCMMKPIGVSTYKIADRKELPVELKPLGDLRKLIE